MSDPRSSGRTESALARWFDANLLSLGRELRLSYLPPLMVYLAAGVSGLTAIVGTFFVKDQLDLSAAFLASLGFWAGLPWALKIPVGHLIDVFWRYKAGFVYLGALLLAASLGIMIGLIESPGSMRAVLPAGTWFVISSLLAPIGYVLQDAVADAMTVEAIPRAEDDGSPLSPERRKQMNTTMQTLGRIAIIGGGVLVSLVNVVMFDGIESLAPAAKVDVYAGLYRMALAIPLISVAGVVLAAVLRRRAVATRRNAGADPGPDGSADAQDGASPGTRPSGWILGGGFVFVALSIATGLSPLPWREELVFGGSLAIVGFLMARLMRELEPSARATLLGTALVIFVFRALPGPGPGATWWQIDALGFDESFQSRLSLIASVLTLVGLFLFRRLMAERSINEVVGLLTVAGFVLSLPTVGLFYGLHEWTSRLTGGIVDARFIALINTAIESPLGQVSMVPMLAWIANSAPAHLKATFFAVMASFTNLALSASQLGTKYLNQWYEVHRAVRDPSTQAIVSPADYGELGPLLIVVSVASLVVPFAAIGLVRLAGWRSA